MNIKGWRVSRYLQEAPSAKPVIVVDPPPREKKWIVDYVVEDRKPPSPAQPLNRTNFLHKIFSRQNPQPTSPSILG